MSEAAIRPVANFDLVNEKASCLQLRDRERTRAQRLVGRGQPSQSAHYRVPPAHRTRTRDVETARAAFVTSRACTDVIVTAIKDKGDFSVHDHLQYMTQAKKEMSHEFQEEKITSILTSLSDGKKRAIQRAVN